MILCEFPEKFTQAHLGSIKFKFALVSSQNQIILKFPFWENRAIFFKYNKFI